MKIAPKQAEGFLKSPPREVLGALVYGPDSGQVEERGRQLAESILGPAAKDPFSLTLLEGSEVKESPSRVLDALAAMSLLGGRQLVRVREASDSIADALESAYAGGKSYENFLLILAGDLPARSKLRRLFEGEKRLASIACYKDEGHGLTSLLRGAFSESGKQADADAITYLSGALGGDRQLIRAEIEKLLLYVGDAPRISLEDARAAVGDAAEGSIDVLVNAVAGGDFATADRSLMRLLHEGVVPVVILRAFSRHFQQLYRLAGEVAKGSSPDAVIAAIKPPLFFKQVPLTRQQLGLWDIPALEEALRQLTEGEIACKTTGTNGPLMTSYTALKLTATARRSRGAVRAA